MEELYRKLIKAYSDENLNRITGILIDLYKNRSYSVIRELAGRISKYVTIDEAKDAKCFSKLIMLYHPDKGEYYRRIIQELFNCRNETELEKHAHILVADDIENIPVDIWEGDDDIDYNPEYIWAEDDEDESDRYTVRYEDEDDESEPEEVERSFYNAVKLREYGHLEEYFPSWYLRDLEEFEMEYCGITSLFGVEYLKHAKVLDLSNNEISDITDLWDLTRLEELYLANNEIGYVDSLSNLKNLRILDLAGNMIDDISPIFELEHLEYLNLMGNKIPSKQIEQLKGKDIVIMQ